MNDKPDGLLARWNLRRQQVETEAETETPAPNTLASSATEEPVSVDSELVSEHAETGTSATQAQPVLTAEDLPDPEKIAVGGSFARFMGDNVDPLAKAAALKALWKQPHYSEIDGLLEYALDYSNQPKLTAEASAELAKKVFRHIVKEQDDEEESEMTSEAVSDEMTATEASVKIGQVSDAEPTSDILDGQRDDLPQNEPEHHIVTESKVV